MKRRNGWLAAAVPAALIAMLVGQTALASVRLVYPSEEFPGPPYYAQISYLEPFGWEVYHTDEWAAIPFYRDPGCVPPDFNLLDIFDVPRAFDCTLTVRGFEIWPVPPEGAGPIMAKMWGLGAVPIYFVRWPELEGAVADYVLTIGELSALPSLRIGYADFFSMNIHPSGLARVPHIQFSATGTFADGGAFKFQVAGGDQSALVKHVSIRFW